MIKQKFFLPGCCLWLKPAVVVFIGFLVLWTGGCKNQRIPIPQQKIKILTFGDSITRGVRDGVNQSQTYTYYLGELLKKRGFNVEMIRKGISGEKTNEALNRLERDVIEKFPFYVTIMYGTNDAYIDIYLNKNNTTPKIPLQDYKKNLHVMVRKLKEKGIKPILMTPIPMGKFWGADIGIYGCNDTNFKLEEYAEAVRRVAAKENVPLVDHFNQWLKWKNRGKDIDTWMTDGIHPNPKGHRLIAAAIFKALNKELKK
jgi:lysophospholipase L1-like esterase